MTAREVVLNTLRVFRGGSDYRAELEKLSAQLTDKRDVALAKQITLGVIRNLALCDYYISAVSNVKLNKIEPQALDILRSAVYQIAFLDKVPKSAAVNEAVAIARKKLNPRAVGFINAVLRKLSAALPELPQTSDNAAYIALKYSHPEWLVREFISRLGETEAEALLLANNTEPPVYARVNTLKTTPERLTAELFALGIEALASELSGTLELRALRDLTTLVPFKEGEFFIQDPASTRAALAVGAKPEQRIIDACAAPGGKTFAMAIEMQNKGEIIAFDTEKKVRLISEGAKRLRLSVVSARAGDSSVCDERLTKTADAVLVDAPCSGFGVIRKKPEIRFKTREKIAELPQQALAILENCASYVKPGGTLIYSTCTLLEAENEGVVNAFLHTTTDYELESQTTYWPHISDSDGFFVAVFGRKE